MAKTVGYSGSNGMIIRYNKQWAVIRAKPDHGYDALLDVVKHELADCDGALQWPRMASVLRAFGITVAEVYEEKPEETLQFLRGSSVLQHPDHIPANGSIINECIATNKDFLLHPGPNPAEELIAFLKHHVTLLDEFNGQATV